MKTYTETRYCVYDKSFKGPSVPLYTSTSKSKAEAKAQMFRTRAKRPLDVEVREETYTYEKANFKLPGL